MPMQKLIFLFLAVACCVRADIALNVPVSVSGLIENGGNPGCYTSVKAGSAELDNGDAPYGITDCVLDDNADPIYGYTFRDVVGVLTNGIDDPVRFDVEYNVYAQGTISGPENVVFSKYTKNGVDLAGYNIKSISWDFSGLKFECWPDPNECNGAPALNVSGTAQLQINVTPEYASPLELAIVSAVVLTVAATARRRPSLAGPRARWRL